MKNLFLRRRKKKQQLKEVKKLQQFAAQTLSLQLQQSALSHTAPGVSSNSPRPIVVSLTSHSSRVNDVYLAVESLFRQSRKADRIVLWLSAEHFSENNLPAILRMQRERGLEVCFCEQDLGPYTKFYYALEQFPDALLITVDDDIMYPFDLIDQLYRAHLAEPDLIHCHRAHLMQLAADGSLLPYKQWKFNTSRKEASPLIFPTGVGGVLYFPGCFDREILDKNAFLNLAPKADDVWLKAMSLKHGTLCRTLADQRHWSQRFLPIPGSQVVKLKTGNKSADDGNDSKIKAVFEHYDLYKNLK